jgi:hypothetical protein
MLQLLYIDIAKVDPDNAHIVMTIQIRFKSMFQMFHLFKRMLQSVLFGCCKNRFGCCIYMHVARIYFKCFHVCLQVFYLDAAYVAMVFKCFSGIFASISHSYFKCFIYLLLYIATIVHLDVLKEDRVLHIGYAWEVASDADNVRVAWATFGAARAHCWCPPSRGRHSRRSFAPCAGDIRTPSARVGHPGTSKFVFCFSGKFTRAQTFGVAPKYRTPPVLHVGGPIARKRSSHCLFLHTHHVEPTLHTALLSCSHYFT